MSEVRNDSLELKISDYEHSAQWVTDARDALKQEIGESFSVEDVLNVLQEPEAQTNWNKAANTPKNSVRYVLALQAGLAHLYGADGLGSHGIDGFYGGKTKTLVKKFQSSWNEKNPDDRIAVDGIMGNQTLPRFIEQLQNNATADAVEESTSVAESQPVIVEENTISPPEEVVTNTEEIPEQEQGEQNLIKGEATEKEQDLSLPETPKIPDTSNLETRLPTPPKIDVPADRGALPVLPVENGVPQALDVPEVPNLDFTDSVTEAVEVMEWQPINFEFEDTYRQWNNETEGFTVQPFERTDAYNRVLAKIEEQITQQFEPQQVQQPLTVKMTHLSRAEVTDKEGTVWLFSTHDVFKLQSSQKENQAALEAEQQKFDEQYQAYIALRQRLSSFTSRAEALTEQNEALTLISTSADDDFWGEFNEIFEGLDVTFSEAEAYADEYNAQNPDNPITTEQAYEKWLEEWGYMRLQRQKLIDWRNSLITAQRQAQGNLIEDEAGNTWEERFYEEENTISTIVRSQFDADNWLTKTRSYDGGFFKRENLYEGERGNRRRKTDSYSSESGNIFKQSEEQYIDGGWQTQKNNYLLPDGKVAVIADFSQMLEIAEESVPRTFVIGENGNIGSFAQEKALDSSLDFETYLAKLESIITTEEQWNIFERYVLKPEALDGNVEEDSGWEKVQQFFGADDFDLEPSEVTALRNFGRRVTGVDALEASLETEYGFTIETEVVVESLADADLRPIYALKEELEALQVALTAYPSDMFRTFEVNLLGILENQTDVNREGEIYTQGGHSENGEILVTSVEKSFHHEMQHHFDLLLSDRISDNEAWVQAVYGEAEESPYTYSRGAAALANYDKWKNLPRPQGFARIYGQMGGANEDQATVAEALLRNQTEILSEATSDPVLARKIELVKEFYLVVSNGRMDAQFWVDYAAGRVDSTYWQGRPTEPVNEEEQSDYYHFLKANFQTLITR